MRLLQLVVPSASAMRAGVPTALSAAVQSLRDCAGWVWSTGCTGCALRAAAAVVSQRRSEDIARKTPSPRHGEFQATCPLPERDGERVTQSHYCVGDSGSGKTVVLTQQR
jgi:hypothetical protein